MNSIRFARLPSLSTVLISTAILLAAFAALPAYAQTASCSTLGFEKAGSGSTVYTVGSGTPTCTYSPVTNVTSCAFQSADAAAAQSACQQESLSLHTSGVCQTTESVDNSEQTYGSGNSNYYLCASSEICQFGSGNGGSTYYFYPSPASVVAASQSSSITSTYNGGCIGSGWCTYNDTQIDYGAGTCTYTPPAAAAPAVSLSASPTSITQGNSSELTWSSTNANSCTGTGFSTGGSTSGTLYVTPGSTGTYNYYVSCTGSGVSANASASVTVSAASSCVSTQGQSCTSAGNSCSMTNSGTTQCNGSCSASTPSNSLCSSCVSNYDQSCTSSANSCSMTNSGSVQCDGSCSVSAPPDSACSSVLPDLAPDYNLGGLDASAGTHVWVALVSSYEGTNYTLSTTPGSAMYPAYVYHDYTADTPYNQNIASTFTIAQNADGSGVLATLHDSNAHWMSANNDEGASSDSSYTFNTPGTYYLQACVNDYNGTYYISESNYGNNCTSWQAITVTSPAPVADLVVPSSDGKSQLSSQTYNYGATPTLDYICENSQEFNANISPAVNGAIYGDGNARTVPTYPLTQTTVFTLTCNGTYGGTATSQFTANVTTPPSCNISATPNPDPYNNPATLTWSSNGASSCSGSSTPSGWSTNSCNGSKSVTPTATSTYSFQCVNSSGTSNANTTLGVSCGGNPTPTLQVDGSAGPVLIKPGDTPQLSWTVSGTTGANCSITGTDGYNYPVVYNSNSCTVPSGSHAANPISHQTVYTMTCSGISSKPVIVNVVPQFNEF